MTRPNDPDPGFDPRVADWIEEGPYSAPGQVLATVLAAVPSVPQGRTVRLPRRLGPMTRLPNLAATAAVLAVIAIVGSLTIGPRLGGGSIPSLDATPSAVASPSAVPSRRPARNGAIAVVIDTRLVLVDPTTGATLKVLVEGPTDPNAAIVVTDLAWAPDGQRLAYAATGGVWVMDVSDGVSRKIVTCGIYEDACSMAWSPDGARIAVAQAGRLELVDPDAGDSVVIHREQDSIVQPVWLPDGGRIAFQTIGRNPDDQGRRLVTIERDGSGRTELLGPEPGIGVWDPAWSPDGSTIAYLGSTDVQICSGSSTDSCQDAWDLHVMAVDLDTLEPRELSPAGRCFCLGFAPGLDWSPDGTSLAFTSLGGEGIPQGDPTGNDGDSRLLVMNADGTGLRYVAAQAWGTVAWQPVPEAGL